MGSEKNMKNLKTSALIFLIVVLICTLPLFGGCTGQDGDKGQSNAKTAGKDSPLVTIRWFQEARGQDPNKDRILQEIQNELNIKLEFVAAPAGQESEKLNLMVSTGEQLDLVTAFDIDRAAIQWAKDDFIYAYDEFMESGDYPRIKAILDSDVYKDLKVNGKSYFKPQPLWPGLRGYVIRKDWLDNLGLEIPTTIDEYYNVLRAFRYDDPDNNGKEDTYGFFVAEPVGTNSFGYICRAYAVCAGWGGDWTELPDGTISQFGVTDAAREAFRFIKKCYDEDLFNKSFVNEKDASGKVEDLVVQGKLGITDLSQPANLEYKIQEAGVDIDVTYLPPLKGVNGTPAILPHTGGYWSCHILPKTSKNPERVLDLLEWALSEEGRELTLYGIKGVHFNGYEAEGNNRIYDVNKEAMQEEWNTSDYGYIHPLSWGGFNYCENAYIPIDEYGYDFDEAFKNINQWMTADAAVGKFANWYSMNAEYACTV
jgi:putative aldouronate transport system substrate-binding protein